MQDFFGVSDTYCHKKMKFVDNLATNVVKLLRDNNMKLSLAESCTGGMLSQAVTSVPGASEIFELGICCYSDRIKINELGVSKDIIEKHSAVSREVALALAKGIALKAGADIGVGITGYAGPGGGTDQKPVGTVFVCVYYGPDDFCVENLKLYETEKNLSREKIRIISTEKALLMISNILLRKEELK